MASEKIISAGVFTQENDLSYFSRGISEIGASVIGWTKQGPAFQPTVVESYDEFTQVFGGKNEDLFVPYLADEYLRNSGKLTVTRVLGGGTFSYSTVGELSSGSVLHAVIRPTASASGDFEIDITGSTSEVSMSAFDLHLSCSADETTYSDVSLNPSDSNFVGKIIGENPRGPGYFYLDTYFKKTISASIAAGSLIPTGSITSTSSATITTTGYSHGESPTVISQTFGATNHELFKFHMLSDGTESNQMIKVGVFAVKASGSVPNSDYGSFGIVVRKYSDNDGNPVILETYNNLTLDPNSPNYIARRIGDQYTTTAATGKKTLYGDFEPISKYIRVEMISAAYPKDAVPFGFKNYKKYNSTAPDAVYKLSQSYDDEYTSNAYFGIDFEDDDVKNFNKPLPTNKANNSSNFLLSNCAEYSSGVYSGAVSLSSATGVKQFMFGFQDGFDGFDPRKPVNEDRTFTTATTSGSVEFKKAIDSVKSPDEYDYNMLLIPDVEYGNSSYVIKQGLQVCESRGDCFMILDLGGKTDSRDTCINRTSTLDSSYGASYYPWVQINDEENSKPVWVPPSVVMAGIISYTDKVAHEWYAPAGLNRGGLTRVNRAYDRLDKADRDALQEARINPLATFPDTGVVAWGQKTLQVQATALDRINVRRLLIKIKKTVASATKYLNFEQSDEALWSKFKNIVNPVLTGILANAGISEFKVVMDETNNTPDVIDRNEVRGDIYIKPKKSAEFILLDFNIMSQAATFTD